MLPYIRWLKVGYLAALTTTLILLLSKPQPIEAQRTIAYGFLPGVLSNVQGMGVLAGFSNPLNSYSAAQQMLAQAGIPLTIGLGGGLGANGSFSMMGAGGGVAGMGGFGGNMMGMGGFGGNMMGMGGFGGNMMGMGGFGGNMMGMGGGMMGMGGMGGFAGKGFGGFNGKKPI